MDDLKQRQVKKLWALGVDTVEIADVVETNEAQVILWLDGWRTVQAVPHRVSP